MEYGGTYETEDTELEYPVKNVIRTNYISDKATKLECPVKNAIRN